MAGYELTGAADQDLETIFEFGLDTFSIDQAVSCQNGMQQRFAKLAEQPKLYPAVDHILAGKRRSVCGSHSMYYRNESQGVVIVLIMGKQDSANALP